MREVAVVQINQETQAIIDSLSDPVLILGSRQGRFVACNTAFVRELGFFGESFEGRSFIRMPQFTRPIRRGMLALYLGAKHRKDDQSPFFFPYADPQGNLKTLSATADILNCGGGECVLLQLRVIRPADAVLPQQIEDLAAFKALVDMTREPWMEFRPHVPIAPMALDNEERLGHLLNLGREFVVHRASDTAQKMFGQKNSEGELPVFSLAGKDFISLFYREEDALRFLDMLSNVGQLRAHTTLIDGSGDIVEVEMSCSVRFGTGDAVTALYCIPRVLEQNRSSRIPDSAVGQEHEFIFSQPFLGLGQLVPLQPLARPDPANADDVLDGYLDNSLLIAANDALADLYGVHRNSLLMQPMSRLFPERSAGIHVLRELFVTRHSSFADSDEETGEIRRTALFKAIFNNADQLVRIFVAVSPQAYRLREQHSGQKPRSTPSFI